MLSTLYVSLPMDISMYLSLCKLRKTHFMDISEVVRKGRLCQFSTMLPFVTFDMFVYTSQYSCFPLLPLFFSVYVFKLIRENANTGFAWLSLQQAEYCIYSLHSNGNRYKQRKCKIELCQDFKCSFNGRLQLINRLKENLAIKIKTDFVKRNWILKYLHFVCYRNFTHVNIDWKQIFYLLLLQLYMHDNTHI